MAEIDEAAVDDTPAVDTPDVEPEAPAYDWGDYKDEPWAQRYADPKALYEGKLEGDQTVTRQAQELADYKAKLAEYEATPEEPWTPLQGTQAPANVDPVFYGKVEQNYRLDPVGTFRELVQGGAEYASYASLVYEALEGQLGKFQTQQLYLQIQQEQYEASTEERIAQAIAEFQSTVQPVSQHVQMQIADVAIQAAKQAAPDFDDYIARISEAIAKNPAYIADVRGDSAATTERMLQMRDMFWAADQRTALTAKPQTPAAPVKPTARRGVIGRNDASRPEDSDREQQLRDSMRNTKVRDVI